MSQLSPRRIYLLAAISLAALILFTLLMAPTGDRIRRGSTYSRSPSGYGAWYAFMQERGTPVQRWQKPIDVLVYPDGQDAKAYQFARPQTPITLVQIAPDVKPPYPNSPDEAWIKTGNVLVLLGVKTRVTDAPFTTDLDSASGKVRIETSRRSNADQITPPLKDSFGAIVWQKTLGKGRLIYASTPYLAANAYQDFRANYEFLAKLVTEPGHPVWIDEYLHGYADPVTATKDGKVVRQEEPDLLAYLMKTPLSLVVIQTAIILLVLIWGQNRRLGPFETLATPAVDNSEAYIQAMAGVLHKAGCSEFVLDVVGKAEQLAIQKALGLGNSPLPLDELAIAWEQQTGRSPEELQSVLRSAARQRRMSESDLLRWVDTVQTVRRHLPGT
ncbi:MAG: DUF4350 domain-containing protein [Leptolyngbyaceae cyanobacterium RU_5_1]|nr:DUF4350 domain-containing protein [Leptolyngbyaceae cyanobacterium RU_5_1]